MSAPATPRTRAATIARWVILAPFALVAGLFLMAVFFARLGGGR